jgi:hypothetical protein
MSTKAWRTIIATGIKNGFIGGKQRPDICAVTRSADEGNDVNNRTGFHGVLI